MFSEIASWNSGFINDILIWACGMDNMNIPCRPFMEYRTTVYTLDPAYVQSWSLSGDVETPWFSEKMDKKFFIVSACSLLPNVVVNNIVVTRCS